MPSRIYISPEFTRCSKEKLHQKIEYAVSELGIPNRYKGLDYLKRAIEIVYTDPDAIYDVVDGLYKTVADEYQTTVHCVERNCRTVIRTLWKKGDPQAIGKYFAAVGSTYAFRPTVREFIAVLSEELRCEFMSEYVSDHGHSGNLL